DVNTVKTLLAAGADPNQKLTSGNYPFVVAMSFQRNASALALIEGGADVTIKDRTGSSPLHLAAQQGALAVVKELLAKGVDPNVRTPRAPEAPRAGGGGFRGGTNGEQTPLMMAARGDQEAVMRALVAAGADPALVSQDGSTVLMAAAGGARLKTMM